MLIGRLMAGMRPVEVAAALGISPAGATRWISGWALRTRLLKVAALLCDGVISLQIARTAVTRTSPSWDRDALEVVDGRIGDGRGAVGAARRPSWKRPWICGQRGDPGHGAPDPGSGPRA